MDLYSHVTAAEAVGRLLGGQDDSTDMMTIEEKACLRGLQLGQRYSWGGYGGGFERLASSGADARRS